MPWGVVLGACADSPVEASGTDGSGSTTAGATTMTSAPTTATTADTSTSSDAGTSSATSETSQTQETSASTTEPTTGSDSTSGSTSTSGDSTSNGSSSETQTSSDGGSSSGAPSSDTGGGSSSTVSTDPSTSTSAPETAGTTETGTTDGTTTGGSSCGDGQLDPGEDCDDGNQVGGDGCEIDCTSSDDVQPEWIFGIGGPNGYPDCGTGVAFDGEGNLIIAGFVAPDVMWIQKYDVGYVEQWTVTYPSVAGGSCNRVGVATDAAGNVGFVGEVSVIDPDTDVFFGVLNPDGVELWSAQVGGLAVYNDYAGGVAFDPDGNLLVTGGLTQVMTSPDIWVAKYDPTGTMVWDDEFDGAGGSSDLGYGVAVDSSGNVGVVGVMWSADLDGDIFTRKYDPDGAILWTDIVGGPDAGMAYDYGFGIVTAANQDIVVAGTLKPMGLQRDGWLRRYDAQGAPVWTELLAGTAVDGDDDARGVAVAADNTILVAGNVHDDVLGRDGWLARVSEDGEVVWERRRDAERWFAVASAPDGRVAVAGGESFPFPNDYDAWWMVYRP